MKNRLYSTGTTTRVSKDPAARPKLITTPMAKNMGSGGIIRETSPRMVVRVVISTGLNLVRQAVKTAS